MPNVARVGDADTNHPPCSAGSCATGSNNVIANNIPVHRVGDTNTPHGFILCVPHSTALVTGSPNVFANNQAVGRIGDAYSCGITVNAGSPNVIANG